MSIKGFYVDGEIQKYDYSALENLPSEKIFWAIYNTTIFTDIEAASNMGKIVMLKLPSQFNNIIIPLVCFTIDDEIKHAEFCGISGSDKDNSYIYTAQCEEETNFWSMDRQLISEIAPIQRVNNKTGNVVLNASDVGALPVSTMVPKKTSDLTNDSGFVNTSQAIAAAPVKSVNGQTGAVSIPALPSGGNVGQVLAKASGTNYDTEWVNQSGGGLPTGGSVGQVLTMVWGDDNPDYPAWEDLPEDNAVIFNFTLDVDSQVTRGPTWNEVYSEIGSKIVFARVIKANNSTLYIPLTHGVFPYEFNAVDFEGLVTSIIADYNGVQDGWIYRENDWGDSVNNLWVQKLDNNLGSENAGKILVVGSDGNIIAVTMSEWQGGNY